VRSPTVSVGFVGDSHLAEPSSRPVRKLGSRLRARGFAVDIRARGGSRVVDLTAQLERPLAVDICVWSLGTNDAAPWKQVLLEDFIAGYAACVGGVRARHILLGPPPVAPGSPRTPELIERYSSAVAEVARRTSSSFLPLLDVVRVGDLLDDGVHLSDSAFEQVEAAVMPIISELTVSSRE
jgi:lysophospholipase L1-like esterase